MAACIAAFDQFMFKLQSEIGDIDSACSIIGFVVWGVHL